MQTEILSDAPASFSLARLTHGAVAKTLINLSLPMIWGSLIITLCGLVDTYFIAKLGTKELAAFSFTFPVVGFLTNLIVGLGVGLSSVLSRALGEGDKQKAKRLTTDNILLCLLLAFAGSIIGWLTITPLFSFLGADEALLPLIREYMGVWYLGLVFTFLTRIGSSTIRAAGNTLFPSAMMALIAITNVLLNPLLILGWFGFPRLGLEGAAWAFMLSRVLPAFAMLIWLGIKEDLLAFALPRKREFRLSLKAMLHVGLPTASTNVLLPLSAAVVTWMLSQSGYGSEAVAAFGVATRIESLALIVFIALSSSLAAFVGQNYGAKRFDRVHHALRLSFAFCFAGGIVVAIVVGYFSREIAGIFNENPDIIALVSLYLLIVPVSYGAEAIILSSVASFNALGMPKPAALMTLTRSLVVFLPLAYIGRNIADIAGIFAAASLTNFLIGMWAQIWCGYTIREMKKSG